MSIDARGRMSLLFHADLMNELLEVAWRTGLLARLDEAPQGGVCLRSLAKDLEMVPARLYKALDCLEGLGFVHRTPAPTLGETRYESKEPLDRAAEAVFADESIERDRRRQPWGALHGRLREVLQGAPGIPEDEFAWPPSADQAARFAGSMAAGIPPIAEAFSAASLFDEPTRVLDVGGGNGTLARHLAESNPRLSVDVLELPELREATLDSFAKSNASDRLGFLAGDAIEGELPDGYDAFLFVRILHDWPDDVAQALLSKAAERTDRIVVCEEFRTPSRLATQAFWSFFLIGVDSCVSRLREWGRYARWLRELGFESELHPGPFDIGEGRR